jgi:hypothetical protein
MCFAPDSGGRLFVPVRDEAAHVLVFMHPDVVRVERKLQGVVEEEPMRSIEGLDGVWVTVSRNDEDAVGSAYAADGSDVYIAEYAARN